MGYEQIKKCAFTDSNCWFFQKNKCIKNEISRKDNECLLFLDYKIGKEIHNNAINKLVYDLDDLIYNDFNITLDRLNNVKKENLR